MPLFIFTYIFSRCALYYIPTSNSRIITKTIPKLQLIQSRFRNFFDIKKVPRPRLDELELWNCFSYYPSVTTFDILDGKSGQYFGKDKKLHRGAYLFTIDFAHPESNIVDTDHSEIPHEHKCAHIMALEDGNYAAQPNNRILWDIPSFTVKNEIPDWKVQTSEWNVEDTGKWKTEDTDRFFYKIEENKNDDKN